MCEEFLFSFLRERLQEMEGKLAGGVDVPAEDVVRERSMLPCLRSLIDLLQEDGESSRYSMRMVWVQRFLPEVRELVIEYVEVYARPDLEAYYATVFQDLVEGGKEGEHFELLRCEEACFSHRFREELVREMLEASHTASRMIWYA